MLRIVIVILVGLSFFSSSASATVITVRFDGIFDSAFDNNPLVPIGTSFSGQFTYNSNQLPDLIAQFDDNGMIVDAEYRYNLPIQARIRIGNRSVSTDAQIAIADRLDSVNINSFELFRIFFMGSEINVFGEDFISIGFVSSSLPARSIQNFRLPNNPLFFTNNEYRFSISQTPSFRGNFSDNVNVTAVLSPVPEPRLWSMIVLGFGFAGCVIRRQKARRAGSKTYYAF